MGPWGDPICQKFPEGKRGREMQPPFLPFFPFFTSTRATKEDLPPSVSLTSIAFDLEKQEERMDE